MMNLKLFSFSNPTGKFKNLMRVQSVIVKASFWQKAFQLEALVNSLCFPLLSSLWEFNV